SFLPSKLRCIGSQVELIVLAIGENMAGKSLTCSAVRHLDDWRGVPAIPPFSAVLVILHRPASIPSAKAIVAGSATIATAMAAAKAGPGVSEIAAPSRFLIRMWPSPFRRPL